MTYLSVCSGIEAVSVAWEPLGFTPVGFAEIEPFPCELLKQKYPAIKNYGDITQYEKWDTGKFDILVGGTPCQSFSIAGKRGGTNDIRGRLMYSYLDIVGKYKPQWVIWENVPGVLSSGKGLFASFLSGLEEYGYGWAYRVLDAQYFGVPQRRRRVFVIGHSDNRTDLAAKVLFEQESMRGNIKKSRKEKEETSGRPKESTTSTMYLAHPSDSRFEKAGSTADTVTAHYGTGGGNTSLVVNTFLASGKKTAGTLLANCGKSRWQNNQEAFSGDFFVVNGRQTPIVSKNIAQTLDMFSHTNVISAFRVSSFGDYKKGIGTLRSNGGDFGFGSENIVLNKNYIRRLTPLECERLQGFPDNYTQIEWNGKPKEQCPDSHRYKAIGNSMAVPVMRWIGERIKKIEGEKYV